MIKKIIITNIFLYCSYKLIKNIYNASRSLDDFNIPINNLKYNLRSYKTIQLFKHNLFLI